MDAGKPVVSYRNSTSNHNVARVMNPGVKVVSYRNSTSNHNGAWWQYRSCWLYLIEILHQTTTLEMSSRFCSALYLIEILHQTTTISEYKAQFFPLYLIEILHQTTTNLSYMGSLGCCILSKFYIKPQPTPKDMDYYFVVSYRNSTSNHNSVPHRVEDQSVVSYRNSTSNHNVGPHID